MIANLSSPCMLTAPTGADPGTPPAKPPPHATSGSSSCSSNAVRRRDAEPARGWGEVVNSPRLSVPGRHRAAAEDLRSGDRQRGPRRGRAGRARLSRLRSPHHRVIGTRQGHHLPVWVDVVVIPYHNLVVTDARALVFAPAADVAAPL